MKRGNGKIHYKPNGGFRGKIIYTYIRAFPSHVWLPEGNSGTNYTFHDMENP